GLGKAAFPLPLPGLLQQILRWLAQLLADRLERLAEREQVLHLVQPPLHLAGTVTDVAKADRKGLLDQRHHRLSNLLLLVAGWEAFGDLFRQSQRLVPVALVDRQF